MKRESLHQKLRLLALFLRDPFEDIAKHRKDAQYVPGAYKPRMGIEGVRTY